MFYVRATDGDDRPARHECEATTLAEDVAPPEVSSHRPAAGGPSRASYEKLRPRGVHGGVRAEELGALEFAAAGAALAAADGAGLLHALAEGPADAEALATRLGLDASATACVLEVLVARGLVVSDADGYRASEALAADLKSSTASEPGAALHLFAHARRFLRDGVGYFAGSDAVPGRERKYVGAVGYLARRFAALADELAAALAPARRARSAPSSPRRASVCSSTRGDLTSGHEVPLRSRLAAMAFRRRARPAPPLEWRAARDG